MIFFFFIYKKSISSVTGIDFCRFDAFAETTSARIVILTIFVANLSAASASSVLSTFGETGVPISSNDSIVQTRLIYVSHRLFSIVSQVIFNKTKATLMKRKISLETSFPFTKEEFSFTRSFRVLIQTHNDPFNIASPREKLVNLFFTRVERKISNIERCALTQFFLEFEFRALKRRKFPDSNENLELFRRTVNLRSR